MNRKILKISIGLLAYIFGYILIITIFDGDVIQERFFPYLPYQLFFAWVLWLIFLTTLVLAYRPKTILLYGISYSLFLITMLFFRPAYYEHQYTDSPYIWEWGKKLFSHPIIFVNIIGNVALFIPLGILLKATVKSHYKFFFGLSIIVLLETIQYISKRGIFDITDIILNFFGMLLGMILLTRKVGL